MGKVEAGLQGIAPLVGTRARRSATDHGGDDAGGDIDAAHAVVSFDLSGESLHRRGYRKRATEATLKENAAAAVLVRAGWNEIAGQGGGFLDPIIDEVEGVFGVGNVERDLYPNNSFGDFYVRKGQTKLFDGGKETLYPGDLAILVGDVSGKGLPAALLMANLQATIEARLPLELDLARLADQLDHQIGEGDEPETVEVAFSPGLEEGFSHGNRLTCAEPCGAGPGRR